MGKVVFYAVYLNHNAYVFVNLVLQVSRVASEQPDDPSKCRLDERTWVCLFCSQVF